MQPSITDSRDRRPPGRLSAATSGLVVLVLAACGATTQDPAIFDAYLFLRYLDGPKYIFVTMATHAGNLGGVAGADAMCQADSQATGRIFKALIVDKTNRVACTTANCTTGGAAEHKDWVLESSREYRRLATTTVIGTANGVGLFPFPLTNAFAASGSWWTGTQNDWQSHSDLCMEWTLGTIGGLGDFGVSGVTATAIGLLAAQAGDTCDTLYRLVCVQQ